MGHAKPQIFRNDCATRRHVPCKHTFNGVNIRAMFRWFRNRVKLYKINRQERKLNTVGERFLKESREKNEPTIIDNWYDDNSWQYDSIRWSRKELVSNALMEEADQLHLPRPKFSEKTKWEQADEFVPHQEEFVLTPEAMMELRGTIRKERREQRENAEFWVKIIGGVIAIATGLVGALIGLFAVLKHR